MHMHETQWKNYRISRLAFNILDISIKAYEFACLNSARLLRTGVVSGKFKLSVDLSKSIFIYKSL